MGRVNTKIIWRRATHKPQIYFVTCGPCRVESTRRWALIECRTYRDATLLWVIISLVGDMVLFIVTVQGTIPAELGSLRSLEELNLRDNRLTGECERFDKSLLRYNVLDIGVPFELHAEHLSPKSSIALDDAHDKFCSPPPHNGD